MLFGNLLTTENMLATYQGKLVYIDVPGNPLSFAVTQDALDEYIANNATWGSLGFKSGPPVSVLRKEDGQPVSDADRIPYNSVPADAELFITPELAYYIQN